MLGGGAAGGAAVVNNAVAEPCSGRLPVRRITCYHPVGADSRCGPVWLSAS